MSLGGIINMDLSKIKLIVIIQCEIAKRRCSGYHCSQAFYEKSGGFEKYSQDQDMRLLMFECGGCNGKGVNSLLSNVGKCLKKEGKIKPEEVAIHFASCVTLDNHHSSRCMFINHMKQQVLKTPLKDALILEDTWYSKTATRRRLEGIYKTNRS